jgi:hypothetical protein
VRQSPPAFGAGHLDKLPLVRPVRYARIGGALYLVIIVVRIVGPLLTRDRLIVPDTDIPCSGDSADADLNRSINTMCRFTILK